MKKIIYSIALLCMAFVVVHAQEPTGSIGKGDVSVSVNFGVGSYIGVSAPVPNSSLYSLSAPVESWFTKRPILDAEARWFFGSQWAAKITGGFAYGYNPGYAEVPGTGYEEGDIPTYEAVPSSSNLQFAAGLGADRYWALTKKSSQLYFHAGGEFGVAYGIYQQNSDSEAYMGASVGEAYSFRAAPVIGLDFHFAEVLFVGIEMRPLAYSYSVYGIKPQAGLKLLASDNHSFSFIERPMIKFGIKF